MKRTVFFLTIAAFALPGWATVVTLAPATITTSLAQCVTQSGGACGGLPVSTSYDGGAAGPLSGYTTETVGTGANLTASGFSSPTLTASVPLSTANAIVDGEIEYVIEVVGASGPVSLGVNSTGSISIATTAPSNNANLFSLVQLELLSDLSGTAVFNDEASIVYSAGPNGGGCNTSNTSTHTGVATVSASVACGGSTASGGFTETNSYTIQANSPYLVAMLADLNIGVGNGSGLNGATGTVQGTATVDPIFTVPNGYTLALSPGVGNSSQSGVPEPATWTMLAAGLGLLIAAKRRRVNRVNRDGARAR